jgi:predicted patatin/cPLA2 family phospholipase
MSRQFRILSLDGGGAKGFYSLGVLLEIEGLVGPLGDNFDLIYGTSTGSIIAALLARGDSVTDALNHYRERVPQIMRWPTRWLRTPRLERAASSIFKEQTFGEGFRTKIGIVATDWDTGAPRIFKNAPEMARGRQSTFVPGFGCLVADAIVGSCSAYPLFNKKQITIAGGSPVTVVDGGFCANNPAVFAVLQAMDTPGIDHGDIRLISVGTGEYPEPVTIRTPMRYWPGMTMIGKCLQSGARSMDEIGRRLRPGIKQVRINKAFSRSDLAMDFIESDASKLERLFKLGRESFGEHERDIKEALIT